MVLRSLFLAIILCNLLFSVKSAERIYIATIDSKAIGEVFCPVIRAAYKDIGYEVSFVRLYSGRALIEAQQGRLDADLVRVAEIGDAIPEFIRIPVSLGKVEGKLYCRKSLPCSLDVLQNPDTRIATVTGQNRMLGYLNSVRASKEVVSSMEQLNAMFVRGRIDYTLAIVHQSGLTTGPTENANTASDSWFASEVYHYVHEQHRDLVKPLTAALTSQMENINWKAVLGTQHSCAEQ